MLSDLPFLDNGNVIDTRKTVKKSGFGATFFASRYEKQMNEYDKWQKLASKLKKQII